ncbi:MAG: sugar ABC transporter permease [Nitrososphaerota archaeon]|nr:sugar ABC transporter permease [Candidatus Calditenuaceae archaeon]MDW8073399.1 sugar ABC transporter permease [Nitrososphaerota archaeon]
MTSPIKWLFLLPAIIYLVALTMFPLAWSLSLAFMDWKLTKASDPQFVGLDNFIRLFTKDARFWSALSFTAFYVTVAAAIELTLGLILAVILASGIKGGRILRVIYIIPLAVPPIGAAFMWRMMLQEDVGIVNAILTFFGIERIRWFTDPWTARIGLIMIDVWQWTPFIFLALLAAIRALPVEPLEAAKVDGASEFKVLQKIIIPLLKPVIVTLVLIRCIDAFKLFDLVYGVTGGGPGLSTESASFYIYLVGRSYFDLGYASAASYIMLIIMMALSITLLWRLRRTW